MLLLQQSINVWLQPFNNLLTHWMHLDQITQKPTQDSKLNLAIISKKVATSVTEIVHAAEAIKGEKMDRWFKSITWGISIIIIIILVS